VQQPVTYGNNTLNLSGYGGLTGTLVGGNIANNNIGMIPT